MTTMRAAVLEHVGAPPGPCLAGVLVAVGPAAAGVAVGGAAHLARYGRAAGPAAPVDVASCGQ
jgi:hypothetical protein